MTATLQPSSALVYRERDAGAAKTVVALHDKGADSQQLEAVVSSLSLPVHFVAPQAARSCNPLLGGGNRWGDYGGYRWFLELDDGASEPATFGDSFLQLQHFLTDVVKRNGGSAPLLIGYGQGGTLALALAITKPHLVTGAIAIEAVLPNVGGWAIDAQPMADKPVTLIVDAYASCCATHQVEATCQAFTDSGANADVISAAGIGADPIHAVELVDTVVANINPVRAGAA